MKVGEIYAVTLGYYSDKYLVTADVNGISFELKRVRLPKTKIDSVMLPVRISISLYGKSITN